MSSISSNSYISLPSEAGKNCFKRMRNLKWWWKLKEFLRGKCPLRLCLAVYGWIIVGCVWKEKSWWWKQEKARRKRVVSQWYTSPTIHISDIDLGIPTLSRKTSAIFLQLLAMLLQLLFHTFEKMALLYSGAISKYFIVFTIDGQSFLQSIFGCQLQYFDFF